jgi:uncharacterized protein YutE (UPF0331/DUF86 family)
LALAYDEERVRRFISEILKARARLAELQALPQEEFLQDPHKIGSAKYHFIVAIEAAIDLCHHLISMNRFRAPEDYADTFRILGEAGAFSPDFIPQLVRMAKFRNRLVHLYWEADDAEIHRSLRENLSDFDRFIMEVGHFIGLGV